MELKLSGSAQATLPAEPSPLPDKMLKIAISFFLFLFLLVFLLLFSIDFLGEFKKQKIKNKNNKNPRMKAETLCNPLSRINFY